MIDLHSHFLPELDDGAKTVDISIAMIEESKRKGVTKLLSTSHCYPQTNIDIDDFIYERGRAYESLIKEARGRNIELPEIKLASEAHMTRRLLSLRNLDKLCIEGTDYILVELPSTPWTERVPDDVYKLTITGFKPIIAHMERNLHQNKELINALYDLDVLFQVNAESFKPAELKRFTDTMLKNKLLHVLGSDMHNMENRKPNMDIARKSISRRYGKDCFEYLMSNAAAVWNGEEISYRKMKSFKKKVLF